MPGDLGGKRVRSDDQQRQPVPTIDDVARLAGVSRAAASLIPRDGARTTAATGSETPG